MKRSTLVLTIHNRLYHHHNSKHIYKHSHNNNSYKKCHNKLRNLPHPTPLHTKFNNQHRDRHTYPTHFTRARSLASRCTLLH